MHTTLAQFWQDALYSFLSIINGLCNCYSFKLSIRSVLYSTKREYPIQP